MALGIALLYVAVLAFRILRILSPAVALAVASIAAIAGIYHFVSVLWVGIRKWFRDPYSLEALREVEERSRNQPEEFLLEDFAGVYCPSCDEVYVDEVRYCPRCGRSL